MCHMKPTVMVTFMFILNVTAVTNLSFFFLINTKRAFFLRILRKFSPLFTFNISIAENHFFPHSY